MAWCTMPSVAACTRLLLQASLALAALLAAQASSALGGEAIQPWPYAQVPYAGIHGNASNNNLVAYSTAQAYAPGWHALPLSAVVQPNTFSPDGRLTYLTTTPSPAHRGCTLFALDTKSGRVRWCRILRPASVGSAVEVDETGRLFITNGAAVLAFSDQGKRLWQQTLDGIAVGVHFTPQGLVATASGAGTVYLLDRKTGAMVASLNIPAAFNLPATWDATPGAGFFGAGLGFTNNTLAVAPDGMVFVSGRGERDGQGAVAALRLVPSNPPHLEPAWLGNLEGLSATSPAVSGDGRWVAVGDGIGSGAAGIALFDASSCAVDAATPGEPFGHCAPHVRYSWQGEPILGSPVIEPDGTVFFWERGLRQAATHHVLRLQADGVVTRVALPDGLAWNSAMTASANHLLGTASRMVQGPLGGIIRLEHFLVALDKVTGKIAWRYALPADSAASVSLGPDGALYVGFLAPLATFGFVSNPLSNPPPAFGLMQWQPAAP